MERSSGGGSAYHKKHHHHQQQKQTQKQRDGAVDAETSALEAAKSEALKRWHCGKQSVRCFAEEDPWNPGVRVGGWVCTKSSGEYYGAMVIACVNGVDLAKSGGAGLQWLWGVRSASKSPPSPQKLEERHCRFVSVARTWLGKSLLLFKYVIPDGTLLVSCRGVTSPFIRLSSAASKALGLAPAGGLGALRAPAASALLLADVQVAVFEWCDAKYGGLMHYSFDHQLVPCYVRSYRGHVSPLLSDTQELHVFRSSTALTQLLQSRAQVALQANERHREEAQLQCRVSDEAANLGLKVHISNAELNRSPCHLPSHFVHAGDVVYFLDADMQLVCSPYRNAPPDLGPEVRSPSVHGYPQTRALAALQALRNAGRTLENAPELLQQGVGLPSDLWKKWRSVILSTVQGRPNPQQPVEGKGQMLVLVGIPGCGKSYFSKKLQQAGWARVNQDEMRTRKACSRAAEKALKKGQWVLIDRCNFDYQQRHTWIKLAHKYGVGRLTAVLFDVGIEECCRRVVQRTDHPTIAHGTGEDIVRNFGSIFVPPVAVEGFHDIVVIRSFADSDAAIERFSRSIREAAQTQPEESTEEAPAAHSSGNAHPK